MIINTTEILENIKYLCTTEIDFIFSGTKQLYIGNKDILDR